MRKLILALLLLALLIPVSAKAEGDPMNVYLVPIGRVNGVRIPKYFDAPKYGQSGIVTTWYGMDYGYVEYALVIAPNITPADNTSLISHADVYRFPDNLDQSINDKAVIDVFFEAINLPTNWTTPSTTYRELLRYVAGMMQFNNKYAGLAAASVPGEHSIFDGGRTLSSNWNSLSVQEQGWFNAAAQFFQPGTPNVTGNPPLRTLAKRAGDLWANKPFSLGGFIF